MKDIGNPIEEKIEYLNPLDQTEEINNYFEKPITSVSNGCLNVHNLTNSEGGITLTSFQAIVLDIEIRKYLTNHYKELEYELTS